MTTSDRDQLFSDPEREGLPGIADDESSADLQESNSRPADGRGPAALPSDHPIAVNDFGTTAEEQRQGESLDGRLKRERPDLRIDDPADGPQPLSDAIDDIPLDAEVETDDPRLNAILEAEDPALDSEVSVYDRLRDRPTAGRLVEPNEGTGADTEDELYAEDRGPADGGLSAEEAAVHEEY
jgi:Family of unknown function (DUF5709)